MQLIKSYNCIFVYLQQLHVLLTANMLYIVII